ncbi:Gastrula zinc finger protein XlCGF26.1 [Papilio machaon]|uniref:Gastrula zinc finger protein XlCGF26.1 n=1 Tax=Papilio machaon TaxID=76193 RepID=A0A194R9B4_PAPMA|nr:Gastrula zinc finger protein XlCGF26.1 [Papilio machaon]
MNVKKGKGPIFDPGLCRCCGTMKKCRVLNVEYDYMGVKEVYSDIMMDCFGLLLSHLDGKPTDRLVCATCVMRLREAHSFRQQVLRCEEAFQQVRMSDDTLNNHIKNYDSSSDDEKPLLLRKRKKLEAINCINKPKMQPENAIKTSLDRMNGAPVSKMLKQRLPMSKVQQLMRERDPTYKTETNVLTIVEYSYACPFRCRHNNLLCYYCGENFLDPQQLRQHTAEIHHPKKFKICEHRNIMLKLDLTRIDCRLCATKINTLDDFKMHITNVHNKIYYFDKKDAVLPFLLTKDESKCALCDETFPYFHALNKHMNEHYNNFVCETCGLGFVDKGRLAMHQQRHEVGNFPCDTCGKVFKAENNRELHIDRVHKKRARVFCPKCDIRLMTHQQKLKHLVEVHGEEPLSFPCNLCDKVYESRRSLTTHRRKDHLRDYRYECNFCGHKFFTRFALNNHMPTHTGERNFKCKVCEKTYPRLKTLKDHMRIHNNDRRYRCHICGQAFIQNCSLKGHMKSQHPEYG